MSSEAQGQEKRPGIFKRFPCLHFLWAQPLAIALSLVPLFYAAINMCGVSGCSGGGFGVAPGDPREQYAAAVVVAAILVTPLAAIPWARKWIRLSVAIVVALVLALVLGAEFQPPEM